MADRAPSSPPEIAGYSYLRPLGVGGFADVFLYEQDMPRRLVAVKVLLEDVVTDQFLQMFMAEANAMAQLSTHPSILTIYQASISSDGRPFLVLEYCPKSIGERYRQEAMSVPDVLYLGIRIASALATAHRKGILHRDIKPSNILITEYALPVLADFGIAGSTIDGIAGTSALSLPWSSPEVVNERTTGDVQSEVWSLGATLYALLAGKSPFERPGRGQNSPEKLRERISAANYQPIPRADVPQELQSILAKAMSGRPVNRYSSMEAFANDLQRVQQRLNQPLTQLEINQFDGGGGNAADASAWRPPTDGQVPGPARTNVELDSRRPVRGPDKRPSVSLSLPSGSEQAGQSSTSGRGWMAAALMGVAALTAVIVVGAMMLLGG